MFCFVHIGKAAGTTLHTIFLNNYWSSDDFLVEENFSNFMTKRLAGTYDLEKAKERLNTSFSFVGLTELFEQPLLIMKYRLFDEDFDLIYQKKRALFCTKKYSSNSI